MGGVWTPPSGFFKIAQEPRRNRGAARLRFLAHLSPHLFRTLPENFDPRSPQVRSRDQVKWPDLRKSLRSCHGDSGWAKALLLSGIGIPISTYNLYISDFLYRWPKVRSFSWPAHYKSMGEKSFASKSIQIGSTHSKSQLTRLVLMTSVQIGTSGASKGHPRSDDDVIR